LQWAVAIENRQTTETLSNEGDFSRRKTVGDQMDFKVLFNEFEARPDNVKNFRNEDDEKKRLCGSPVLSQKSSQAKTMIVKQEKPFPSSDKAP